MRARARVYVCFLYSVFYIQNKLYRFETQIRHGVPSQENSLSEKLRQEVSSRTIKWKIVIHMYIEVARGPFPRPRETTFDISLVLLWNLFVSSFVAVQRGLQKSRDKSATSSNDTMFQLRDGTDLLQSEFYTSTGSEIKCFFFFSICFSPSGTSSL